MDQSFNGLAVAKLERVCAVQLHATRVLHEVGCHATMPKFNEAEELPSSFVAPQLLAEGSSLPSPSPFLQLNRNLGTVCG